MNNHPVIDQIIKTGILPEIPKFFGETLNLLLDPDTYSVDTCIDKILSYPELEAKLIDALNNSARLNRSVNSIREAVVYLGPKNSRIIAISYISKLLVPYRGNAKIFSSRRYWNHCVGTAIAGEMIAEETGLSNKDKIFTYGLVHDIGVTVLDNCMPDQLDQVYNRQMKGLHQIAAEKIVLQGITHAEIGGWFCGVCGLSSEVIDIVRYHHSPFLIKEQSDEVKIMHLADSISTNYYEKLLGNETNLIYSERVRSEIKLSTDFIEEVSRELPDRVDKFNQTIGSLLYM